MAILKIVKHPDPFLLKTSKPVTEFDERLHTLLDDMLETMQALGNAMGLAAVQVGRLVRAFIVLSVKDEPTEFINPRIISASKKKNGKEACVSIRNCPQIEVERFQRITVAFQDRHGVAHEREFRGMEAVCIQHEFDHLDGKLIGVNVGENL